MDDKALTQREFDNFLADQRNWRQQDAEFKKEIRDWMNVQQTFNIRIAERASAVEALAENAEQAIKRRTGLITALASAIATIAGAIGAMWATK